MADDGAIIALGANLPSPAGPPLQSLRHAIDQLAQLGDKPVLFSSPYASAAVDCEPGAPDFINAVALIRPARQYTARSLLGALQDIEREFGRRRSPGGNASRPMDLDLITFADQQLTTPELVLPHPRAMTRAFVLAPLAELLPELVLPGCAVTVRELLGSLPGAGRELRRLSWEVQ